MIQALVLLARLILLAAFTFFFIVLYENGPSGFVGGISREWTKLTAPASR